MSKQTIPSGDPKIVAAFQAVGSAWHAVVARVEAQRPTMVDARVFPGGTTSSAVSDWLASHHVGRVIGVLPGSAIISRTCSLPNGSQAQLDAAIKLQAETQLLGSVPSHRMATAVLQAAPGEPNRSGLILAWPESANVPKLPTSMPATFAPVIASLAALLNGSRPDEPLLLVDRKDGSIALSLTHANGAVFRAARVDTSSSDRGTQDILRSLTETALSVSHTSQYVDGMLEKVRAQLDDSSFSDTALLLPASMPETLATRLHGAPATEDWWTKYGIPAGAILASTDQLAPLTQLKSQPPVTKPSRMRSLSSSISDGRMAFKLIAACILIVILAPVAFAGLRLLVLNIRYPGLDDRLKEIEKSKQQLAMYSDLKNQAWSMTKILSDVVISAPEGIELDSIAVDFGKELRVKGTAKSQGDMSANDVILTMQSNMQEYGVFTQARPSWDNGNAMGTTFEFSLVANILDPHKAPVYPETMDFAGMTLADRRYGKPTNPADTNAEVTPAVATRPEVTQPTKAAPSQPETAVADETNGATGEPATDDSAVAINDPARPGRHTIGDDRTERAGGTSSHGGGDSSATPVSNRIPEPLSDGQIAAMSLAEAQHALAEVAAAIRRAPGLDQETRDRLNHEFKQLLARTREGEK